jgi:hypothetical protein
LEVRRVACRGCGKVKRERLDHPSTMRFVLEEVLQTSHQLEIFTGSALPGSGVGLVMGARSA